VPYDEMFADAATGTQGVIETNNLDHLAKTATAGADMTAEVADDTVLSRILANGDTSAFDPSTDGLQPIHDDRTLAAADYTVVGDLGTVQSADNDTKLTSILALLDDARTEPGDVAPPVNPDAMTKIDYLYKFLRNKIETTATRIHVYDDAGTNKDQSSVISDDGTTFTRGEFGAGD